MLSVTSEWGRLVCKMQSGFLTISEALKALSELKDQCSLDNPQEVKIANRIDQTCINLNDEIECRLKNTYWETVGDVTLTGHAAKSLSDAHESSIRVLPATGHSSDDYWYYKHIGEDAPPPDLNELDSFTVYAVLNDPLPIDKENDCLTKFIAV